MNNLASGLGAKYWLLIILVVAFILRVNRLDVGFPGLFVSNDEAIFHQSALNMIAEKTPFTLGNYGPIGSYLQIPFLILSFLVLMATGRVNSVGDMEILLLTQEGFLLFVPRLISVFFGTLTVVFVYRLSKELFDNKAAALWSSFFTAVSFNLVHISHQARSWSAAIFFTVLAVYFSARSLREEGNQKWILLSFAAAAIAFGFHQLSGLVFFTIMAIQLAYLKRSKLFSVFSGFALWALMVLVFNFLSLKGDFFSTLAPENREVGLILLPENFLNLKNILIFFVSENHLTEVAADLILTDGVIVLLSLLFLLKKARLTRLTLIIWVFVILNYFLVSTIFPHFIRYLLLSFVFMPLFAGYSISKFKMNRLLIPLSILVLILSSFNSIYWNWVISKKSTFDLAQDWINTKIDQKEMILITERRNFSYVPSERSADFVRTYKEGYYKRSSAAIGESYPINVRDVIYTQQIKNGPQAANVEMILRHTNANYVVDSYMKSDERLLNQNSGLNLELIRHFSPTRNIIYEEQIPEAFFDASVFLPIFKLERPGPYIDIMEVD